MNASGSGVVASRHEVVAIDALSGLSGRELGILNRSVAAKPLLVGRRAERAGGLIGGRVLDSVVEVLASRASQSSACAREEGASSASGWAGNALVQRGVKEVASLAGRAVHCGSGGFAEVSKLDTLA